MTGSKWVYHGTSGTVCECSEIAGFPQKDDSQLSLFAGYNPSGHFSLLESEEGTHWHLVVPGELQDELEWVV
jgi:hypothetical protein